MATKHIRHDVKNKIVEKIIKSVAPKNKERRLVSLNNVDRRVLQGWRVVDAKLQPKGDLVLMEK